MNRRLLIAGNWKMYKKRDDARKMVRELLGLIGSDPNVDIAVCPPFTALGPVSELVKGTRVQLGAQNVHWEEEGAFTGEISAPMLLDYGCRYVILGHSERRQFFGESDEAINRKLNRVLPTELIPILCVGESLQEREQGKVREVILGQVQRDLKGIDVAHISRVVIAYEPVWAIGSGKTATPEIAEKVHRMIRDWLAQQYAPELAQQIRILYGGSVKPDNTRQLMAQANIDGALVGGASLDAQSFARIVGNSQ